MRSAAIIIQNNKILLIHRQKGVEKYYVFPGRGVEKGETAKEAAIREAREELNLDIILDKELFRLRDLGGEERYFLVKKTSNDEIKFTGREIQRTNEQYIPEWVETQNLSQINLLPKKAKSKLLDFIYNTKLCRE